MIREVNSELEKIYGVYRTLNLGGKRGVSDKFVPGSGKIPSTVMFIGEAPGEVEDKLGIPFQGPAGKLFDDLLELIALSREDVFVTNVFKYRPPGNRSPLENEIRLSIPCLRSEIQLVNPKVIFTLGAIAMHSFLPPNKTITQMRNKAHLLKDRTLICTYHPAAVYHTKSAKLMAGIKEDFRLLGETVERLE